MRCGSYYPMGLRIGAVDHFFGHLDPDPQSPKADPDPREWKKQTILFAPNLILSSHAFFSLLSVFLLLCRFMENDYSFNKTCVIHVFLLDSWLSINWPLRRLDGVFVILLAGTRSALTVGLVFYTWINNDSPNRYWLYFHLICIFV
jgi:hypothetical protein